MTTPSQQVRRATIEDLPKLVPLWQQENLPSADLEKRFKEFQVVEGPDGEVLGALGLQMAGLEGRVHSEVFLHSDQADALREQLWGRVQVIAGNFGVFRIWTQLATPFWRSNGFRAAPAEVAAKLPPAFAGEPQPWWYAQLKEEPAEAPVSLDKEFALFRELERERTEKIFRQARAMKLFAALIALAVLLFVMIYAIKFFQFQGRLPGR